jgi:hypothetical protein
MANVAKIILTFSRARVLENSDLLSLGLNSGRRLIRPGKILSAALLAISFSAPILSNSKACAARGPQFVTSGMASTDTVAAPRTPSGPSSPQTPAFASSRDINAALLDDPEASIRSSIPSSANRFVETTFSNLRNLNAPTWLQDAALDIEREGVDPRILFAISFMETRFQNRRTDIRLPDGSLASTATGPFQFTESTWRLMSRRRPDLAMTADDRLDPIKQAVMAAAAVKEIQRVMMTRSRIASGRHLTISELYIAWFLSPQVAREVVRVGNFVEAGVSEETLHVNGYSPDLTVADWERLVRRKLREHARGLMDIPVAEGPPRPSAITEAGDATFGLQVPGVKALYRAERPDGDVPESVIEDQNGQDAGVSLG